MLNVTQILAAKPSGVRTVDASLTVYAAVTLLASHQIGALGVVDEGRPVGMFSERDYARKGIIRGRRAHKTLVSELMSTPLITVRPEQSIEECMQLMTERRIRHLPVMDDGELVGMVTIGDVVKAQLNEYRGVAASLETRLLES